MNTFSFLKKKLFDPPGQVYSKNIEIFRPPPALRHYDRVAVSKAGNTYDINRIFKYTATRPCCHLAVAFCFATVMLLCDRNVTKMCVAIRHRCLYLTGLTYTVIDNPNRDTKFDIVSKALDYMDTDTLLYRDDSTEEFTKIQEQNWDPVLDWFNERFDIEIKSAVGVCGIEIPVEAREAVRRYLLSHNIWTCQGFLFAVEALKSIILPIAAAERKISIQTAVNLSYLETDYQRGHWGNVEWAHDLEKMDHQARFSAAMLYVQLNSSQTIVNVKHKLTG
ncbi:unnamed protein product [Meganyctiphanes norvegica]|uniref:ATP synthase mitochondrial F1 complex assembly factor 2 n=1 Tax=Meganyctiphanes norvegica TaxID=48144 RepID=A0AAV2SBG4_MEGNR